MTSIVQSVGMRQFLAEKSEAYVSQLPGSLARDYLTRDRQLTSEALDYFRLGIVADPVSRDDDMYRGRITIPYLTPAGVVSIRYRTTPELDHSKKYLSEAGDIGRPFNVLALKDPDPTVYITEGEIDAMSCWCAGLPAVGFPGARSWVKVFSRLFRWKQVVILHDGDDAGFGFAETVQKDVGRCRLINMGTDSDVNQVYVERGPEGLRKYVGA